MLKVFIHTNNKQKLGALIAKFAIQSKLRDSQSVQIEFINVDEQPAFRSFGGQTYLRGGRLVTYNPADLQSFTLSRFMPPELMNFQGRAIVIDPDIFCLCDISELFNINLEGKPIACCGKKGGWDTSLMLLDCDQLQHWRINNILEQLKNKEVDYLDWLTLKNESRVLELPRIWNNLDELTAETKLIHMTNRLTQPWRTGLKIDFTRNPLPKLFGFMPREWVHFLLGKYPTHYQPHPNPKIEQLFFNLVDEALEKNIINKDLVRQEITLRHVRPDFFERLARVAITSV